jgi:hypothetical protein
MAEFYAVGSGDTTGTDLGDKSFYGFRLNPQNGHLNVEVINDGVTVVSMPDPSVIRADDYRQFVWTQDTLGFSFDANGHLLLTIY